MPIPTRSISLRDPHSEQSQEQASQDAVKPKPKLQASKLPSSNRSRTVSIPAPTHKTNTNPPPHIGIGARKGPSDHARANSDSATSNRKTAAAAGSRLNPSSRSSLLPQRSGSVRAERASASVLPPVREPQPQPQPQSQSQSLRELREEDVSQRRDSPGKVLSEPVPSASVPVETSSIEPAAASGIAKARTKPPTRLDRSVSLRQPVTPKPVTHSRQRSQVIGTGLRKNGPLPVPKQTTTTTTTKKLPKPATTTKTSAIPGPSTRDSLPTHITPLQTELLQLQLLRSQGLQAKARWETNEENKCRELHSTVVATYQAARASDLAAQRCCNVKAVEQWAADTKASKNRYDFSEQIRILSRVVQGVSDLTESRESRFNSVIEEFERWSAHVVKVRQRRAGSSKDSNDPGSGDGDPHSMDPLGESWKDSVAALTAILELFSHSLDCLELRVDAHAHSADSQSYQNSALVKTVRGHKLLLASMTEELELMVQTEAEVIRTEHG